MLDNFDPNAYLFPDSPAFMGMPAFEMGPFSRATVLGNSPVAARTQSGDSSIVPVSELEPLGTNPGPISATDVSWMSGTNTGGGTVLSGPATSTTIGSGFHINLLYDAAAMAAPQSFRDGVQTAMNLLSAAITDNITVNIKIDYSGTGGGAAAGPDAGLYESYSSVRTALVSHASASDTTFNSLPNTTSINGQSNVAVWNAQLKLFGLLSPNDTTTDDASATFAIDITPNLLVGVALHELTHALGRVPYGSQPDLFDLYRFTSPGTRLFSNAATAPAAYFSLDGGVTKIADYGRTSDPSDFLNSGVQGANDPFNEFYTSSTLQQLTAIDLKQLDALGYHLKPTSQPPIEIPVSAVQSLNVGQTVAEPSLYNPASDPAGNAITNYFLTATNPSVGAWYLDGQQVSGSIAGFQLSALSFHALAAGTETIYLQASDDNGQTWSAWQGNGVNVTVNPAPLTGVDPSSVTISSFSAVIDNGSSHINAGHLAFITMIMTGAATVTGVPTLQLNDSEVAYYTGGSGSNTLQFVYVPTASDNVADLKITGLNLPTGSGILGGDGNAITGTAAADLSISVAGTVTPATVAQEINGLYVTLYGVTATHAGISYWENVLHGFDASVTTSNAANVQISLNDQVYLGQQMTAGSPLVNGTTYFTTLYPASTSDMSYVQALYQNVANFGGTQAGDNYWFNLLQQAEASNGHNVMAARESIAGQFVHDLLSNDLTVGAIALGMSQSDYSSLVHGQQELLNKEVTSQFYADHTAASGGNIINYTTVSSPAFTAAHNLISAVSSDPGSVAVAITGINNAIAHQDLSLI